MAEENPKVQVFFCAAGSAPVLKQRRVVISAAEPVANLVSYLKTQLGVASVLVYLRSAFAPCLSDSCGSLLSAYGERLGCGDESRLVLHYSLTPAWG
jgi:hypothetical protein